MSVLYPGALSAVVTGLCFTTQMVLFGLLVKKTKRRLPHTSILLSYASVISYSLYAFNLFIMSIIAETISPDAFNGLALCLYRYMAPSFFLCGKILMLLFYIVRLYNILHNTSFEYKKRPLICLGIFVVLGLAAGGVCFWVIVITGLSASHASREISNIHDFPGCRLSIEAAPDRIPLTIAAIGTTLIVDLIASIIILRLYLKKLILLSAAFDKFEFKSKSHLKKNEKFMQLILKTTNLVIVSIITEYLTLVVNGLDIGEYWLSFDHTINVLCIYLSFGSADDKEYRLFCGCIDKCCHKCCTRICFCCCLPTQIDDDLQVAIAENSKSSGIGSPKGSVVSSSEERSKTEKSQTAKSPDAMVDFTDGHTYNMERALSTSDVVDTPPTNAPAPTDNDVALFFQT
eukprot:683129_1